MKKKKRKITKELKDRIKGIISKSKLSENCWLYLNTKEDTQRQGELEERLVSRILEIIRIYNNEKQSH